MTKTHGKENERL